MPAIGNSNPLNFRTCISLLLVFVATSSACSNRAMYESFRRANLLECERQPIAQIQACMESNQMTYDEYRRELERIAIEQSHSN